MTSRTTRQFALTADKLLTEEQYALAKENIGVSADECAMSAKEYFADHLVESLTSLFDMTAVREIFSEDSWNAAFGREIKQLLILRRLILEEVHASDVVHHKSQ